MTALAVTVGHAVMTRQRGLGPAGTGWVMGTAPFVLLFFVSMVLAGIPAKEEEEELRPISTNKSRTNLNKGTSEQGQGGGAAGARKPKRM